MAEIASNTSSTDDPEQGDKPKSSGKYQLSNLTFSHFMTETASNASSSDDPEQGVKPHDGSKCLASI